MLDHRLLGRGILGRGLLGHGLLGRGLLGHGLLGRGLLGCGLLGRRFQANPSHLSVHLITYGDHLTDLA